MALFRVALLDDNQKVIGEVFDAPQTGNRIAVAGAFTASGDAVNVRFYSISRSKANLAKAKTAQAVFRKDSDIFAWADLDLSVLG